MKGYILKYVNDRKGSAGCENFEIALLNILSNRKIRRVLKLEGVFIPKELDLIENDSK